MRLILERIIYWTVDRWIHSAMVVDASGIKLTNVFITYIWFPTSRTFAVDIGA
jgi:hypothetical protein